MVDFSLKSSASEINNFPNTDDFEFFLLKFLKTKTFLLAKRGKRNIKTFKVSAEWSRAQTARRR